MQIALNKNISNVDGQTNTTLQYHKIKYYDALKMLNVGGWHNIVKYNIKLHIM